MWYAVCRMRVRALSDGFSHARHLSSRQNITHSRRNYQGVRENDGHACLGRPSCRFPRTMTASWKLRPDAPLGKGYERLAGRRTHR